MARRSRTELAREADKADSAATDYEAAARDARQSAAATTGQTRAQYEAMNRVHSENAAEYRSCAELLRDGAVPEGW